MLSLLLHRHGFIVSQAASFTTALTAFTQHTHTLVVAAERLGNRTGLELIQILHTRQHAPGGIIVGPRSFQRAQAALRSGADEYVARPIDEGDLVLACEHARAIHAARTERAQVAAQHERLQPAFVQVLQTMSLDAQRRLAGYIAHQINNPLTPILGQAELLNDDLAPSDPRRAQISAIMMSVGRIRAVLQQMFDFVRPDNQQRVVTDLVDLLRNTLYITDQRLRTAGIEVRSTLPDRLVLVNSNTQQITDALLHLIDNAFDAMPHGGTLAVTLSVEALLDSSASRAAFVRHAVINIQDTGGGIAPQHLPYIFDLFYSTKARVSPSGVGLALAQSIVVAHDGTVTVDTCVGVGTTFRVTFPLHTEGES